jgi:putative oxidoreductase
MKASSRGPLCSLGLFALRLGMGGYLLTHGIGKLQLLIAGDFESIGDPLGIGPAGSLFLMTFAEFVCALLVMAGLMMRLAALPIIATMAVASLVAHGLDPWTLPQAAARFFEGSMQVHASQPPALIPFVSLALTGPGGFSLDAVLRKRRLKKKG